MKRFIIPLALITGLFAASGCRNAPLNEPTALAAPAVSMQWLGEKRARQLEIEVEKQQQQPMLVSHADTTSTH